MKTEIPTQKWVRLAVSVARLIVLRKSLLSEALESATVYLIQGGKSLGGAWCHCAYTLPSDTTHVFGALARTRTTLNAKEKP